MYFHNCTIGIYAKDASNLQLTQPSYFSSISSVAISLDNHTTLRSLATGNTGISIDHSMYGMFCKSSKIIAQKPRFHECTFGILAQEVSYCALSNANFTYSGPTSSYAAGVMLDMSSVASVYGVSITGYINITGSQTGATFKVVNDSILYVSATGDADRTNITPYGTVRVDPYETSGVAGSVPGNNAPVPPPTEA